jgi:DNA-binding LacI/PurR family transcriptional regulator
MDSGVTVMERNKVIAQDVARRAGVSQSAVSRVFTPGASVSKAMVTKVITAVKELDYRPNALARSLITGRSKLIGLVVAYLENNFFLTEVLEKLSKALQEEGYRVLMFITKQSAENIDDVLSDILDYQVDGVVMASVEMSSELATRCQATGIPVVLFNRSQADDRLSAVTSDNFSGGRKVAEFLIKGGHKNIGYVAGWEGASTQRDRESGFRAGLQELGFDIQAREIGDYRFEGAQEATRRMFASGDRIDAIFAANDHMAFAVMDVLRAELGVRVPDDVSVIGYDDVPLAAWPSYNLTTVSQSAGVMVHETVRILLDQIDDPLAKSRRISFDGPLIVRGSARVPKGWTDEGI